MIHDLLFSHYDSAISILHGRRAMDSGSAKFRTVVRTSTIRLTISIVIVTIAGAAQLDFQNVLL